MTHVHFRGIMRTIYPLDLEKTGEKRKVYESRKIDPFRRTKTGFDITQEELEKSNGYIKPLTERRKDVEKREM